MTSSASISESASLVATISRRSETRTSSSTASRTLSWSSSGSLSSWSRSLSVTDSSCPLSFSLSLSPDLHVIQNGTDSIGNLEIVLGIHFYSLQAKLASFLLDTGRHRHRGNWSSIGGQPAMAITELDPSHVSVVIEQVSGSRYITRESIAIGSHFSCGVSSLSVVIRVVVAPEPPIIDLVTVATVTRVSSVAALMSMSAVTTSTVARLSILHGLVVCQYTPDIQGNSLTSLGFGEDTGYYIRGAVVGNWLAFAAVPAVVFLAAIAHRAVKRPSANLSEFLHRYHFPSNVIFPMNVVLPPTLYASTSLVASSSNTLDIFLAVVSFSIVVSFGIYLCCTVLPPYFRCTLREREKGKFGRFQTLYVGGSSWGCPEEPSWKQRHVMIFDELRYEKYALADLSSTVLLSITAGIPQTTESTCVAQMSVAFACYLLLSVIVCLKIPLLSPVGVWYVRLVTVLTCLSALLLLLGALMNQDDLLIAASDVSLFVSGVSTIKSIMDVVVMLLFSVPTHFFKMDADVEDDGWNETLVGDDEGCAPLLSAPSAMEVDLVELPSELVGPNEEEMLDLVDVVEQTNNEDAQQIIISNTVAGEVRPTAAEENSGVAIIVEDDDDEVYEDDGRSPGDAADQLDPHLIGARDIMQLDKFLKRRKRGATIRSGVAPVIMNSVGETTLLQEALEAEPSMAQQEQLI